MTPVSVQARDLARELAGHVRAAIGAVLPQGARVALIDFPNHPNIGDSAIWLGERTLLRGLGVEVAYAADHRSYDPAHLRRALPDGPVLLHGGGNFGDVYLRHHRLRLRVAADFPDRHVIQLPQSMAFADPRIRASSVDQLRRHPHFTFFARDHVAQAEGADFTDDVRLCPDSAFCLHDAFPPEDGEGLLWIARRDKESVQSWQPEGARVVDWPPAPRRWMAVRRACQVLTVGAQRGGPVAPVASRAASAFFDRLAAERVESGRRLLASSDSVVTDRLHGCILALLCGKPATLLDNSTGKLSAFSETWGRGATCLHMAPTPQAALEHARRLTA